MGAPGFGATPESGAKVGAALRSAREKTGKDLAAVAEQLRIRKPFLQALEEGRHKDLPGGTYAVGFMRTYAEFLDLDGEEMVRRFKQEASAELHSGSELLFPLPSSEGRVPTGAVLFMGLVLAVVAYGGWYWLNSRETKVAEMVPPLPNSLSSVFNRPATLTADKPVAVKPEIAKPDEVPAAKPVDKVKEEVVPPVDDEEAAKLEVSNPPPAEIVPAPVPEPVKPLKTESKANSAKVERAKVEPKPVETKLKAAEAKSVVPAAEPKAPDVSPEPKAQSVTPEPKAQSVTPEPKAQDEPKPLPAATKSEEIPPSAIDMQSEVKPVKGGENLDARVVVKAVAEDCWMQVREMDGKLLISKLLRRGETFRIPNRSGLTLTVGNAGAVEIEVDGHKAGSLGQVGQVRRDINLDPAKLQVGG